MDNIVTQVGIGGIFAIIVLREVFTFLNNSKTKKVNNSVSRSEFDRHKDTMQSKENCRQIVKRLDSAFAAQDKRFDQIDKQFGEVKTLIRNNGQ